MTTAHSYHATEFNPRVSIEEYLEREFYAETKSEYIDGEIVPFGGTTIDGNGEVVAMAGASVDHITIASNLMGEIYALQVGVFRAVEVESVYLTRRA